MFLRQKHTVTFVTYYNTLFECVKEWNIKHPRNPLTICPAIPGSEANVDMQSINDRPPMFVGRSINGWCPLDGVENIIQRICNCESCGLGWVVGDGNWQYCKGKCPVADALDVVDGRINNTPFWQMVKYICEKEYPAYGENWYKKIIWSNLYKASFVYGGNPSGFYKKQIAICNDILETEIKLFNPSKIYFITEANRSGNQKDRTWFCDHYRGTEINFKKVYDLLRHEEWKDKVVVLTRPEFHNKDKIWENREDINGNKIEIKD